jgi:hypothetical protein
MPAIALSRSLVASDMGSGNATGNSRSPHHIRRPSRRSDRTTGCYDGGKGSTWAKQ